jgi:hypothetical protein
MTDERTIAFLFPFVLPHYAGNSGSVITGRVQGLADLRIVNSTVVTGTVPHMNEFKLSGQQNQRLKSMQ